MLNNPARHIIYIIAAAAAEANKLAILSLRPILRSRLKMRLFRSTSPTVDPISEAGGGENVFERIQNGSRRRDCSFQRADFFFGVSGLPFCSPQAGPPPEREKRGGEGG